MTNPTPQPPAGWYADPQGAPFERWWNGLAWTASTRPTPSAASALVVPERPAAPAPPVALPHRPGPYSPAPYPPAAAGYAPPIGTWRSPADTRPLVRGMGDAVRVVFAKYAVFEGRATRPEYWWFFLFTFLVTLGAYILLLIPYLNILLILALFAWGLGLIVPTLALTVRRLRDAGLHWAWIFISLVPFGGIALIVLLCQPGKHP